MDPRKAMCLLQHIGSRQESLSNSFLFSSLIPFWEAFARYRKAYSHPIQPSKMSFVKRRFHWKQMT
jgi:hypothetical protein